MSCKLIYSNFYFYYIFICTKPYILWSHINIGEAPASQAKSTLSRWENLPPLIYNAAYRRDWISWPTRIVAPLPRKTSSFFIINFLVGFLKTDVNLMTCVFFKYSNPLKKIVKKKKMVCNLLFFNHWFQVSIHGIRIQDSGIRNRAINNFLFTREIK